jgi:3'-phosphoadenosine 5'-phosphosulfate sulfotransferase (PAPS reductase)/FAD synthetase
MSLAPYILPEGKVLIAFSGGRTSAYMLHQILEANGGIPDRALVSFQNTGREMPQTLDFVQECGERWGVKIVWLEYRAEDPRFEVVSHNSASRDGEPFQALIRKRKFLPNRVARFCTAELKVHCASRYLKSIGWERWAQAVGIRADEPRRLKGAPPRERYTLWHPLAEAGVSRHDVLAFWDAQPFNLRLPNVDGRTQLGNCDGCFLKSEAARAALARDYPERAQWWADMEALAQSISSRPDDAQFREDGTWAQHINFVARQNDWIFDTEGALCQQDAGECTE